MTTTITEPETKPKLDGDAPPCWPPVQHLVRKENLPVKEGDLTLCGAKLMGLNLGKLTEAKGKVCAKCLAIFEREAAGL